jgi:hypothetical protein
MHPPDNIAPRRLNGDLDIMPLHSKLGLLREPRTLDDR